MGHMERSTTGSTADLAVNMDVDPEDNASLSYAYTRHEAKNIDVEGLTCEVDERGQEWWERLANFQIPWECFNKGPKSRRKILNDVSFQVKSGQMLAVLGSSGSGKTTLLDVIACNYDQGDITGDVRLNGQPRTRQKIKECSAYVRQDDRLLPHLTVKETLSFVAKLKLPRDWSHSEIHQRVNSVISELGLRHVANSKVGGVEVRGISGGERRRVTIGVQLLLDPSVLFLDEPTSGLDSFTAHHLVETLAKLARNNRVVLLSIHQPRSDIFELFDLIMLMSQGDMVYFGKATQMVDHFTGLGHPCPELTNPCDFYVDLTTVDMKTQGTQDETSERVQRLVDAYKSSNAPVSIDSEPPPLPGPSGHTEPAPSYDSVVYCKHGTDGDSDTLPSVEGSDVNVHQPDRVSQESAEVQQTYFGGDEHETNVDAKPKTASHEKTLDHSKDSGIVNEGFTGDKSSTKLDDMDLVSVSSASSSVPSVARIAEQKTAAEQQKTAAAGPTPAERRPSLGGHTKKATPTMQFWVLVRRAIKNNLEDYGFLGVQAIEAVAMALMIGLVYWDMGLDQTSMRDRFGLLYIIGALYPYMIILDVIGAYHREKHTIYFEMQDGLYTEAPYFFSKLISEIPEHTVFIILYTLPMYFLAGLQVEPGLFFQCFAIVFIIVYCSRCLALFCSALLPTYQMSVLMSQSIFTLFLLSSGFIFNLENIFVGVKWTSYISYLKWGYQALCYTEFRGLNFTCGQATQNCIETGEEALQIYSLDGYEVWQCCLIIVAEILAFLFLFYVALRFISQKPHQQ